MVHFLLRSDFTPTCVFGRNITAVVVGRMNLHAVSERTNTLDVTRSCPGWAMHGWVRLPPETGYDTYHKTAATRTPFNRGFAAAYRH